VFNICDIFTEKYWIIKIIMENIDSNAAESFNILAVVWAS